MITCAGCSAEYSDGVRFCPRCGLGAGDVIPELPVWRAEPAPRRWVPPTDPMDDGDGDLLATIPRTGRRRGPLIGAIATVAVVVVALLVWRGVSGHNSAAPPPTIPGPTLITPSIRVSSTPSLPPPSLVGVAPAVQGAARLPEVRDLLTRYFTAINSHHDYAGWAVTQIPAAGRATETQYEGFRTTRDSKISINSVTVDVSGVVHASVSFTSHQRPSLGNGSACLNWSIAYHLKEYHGALRIDQVNTSTISHLSC